MYNYNTRLSYLCYDAEILINGKKIPQYERNGLTYIEGREGTKYSIKVKNNTSKRVKAVVTVDGFSILNDDKTDNESGYIIDGHDTLHVKGFRTSDTTEAVFTFSRKGESRAQKVQGNAKNAGVIGIRIVDEKVNPAKMFNDIAYGGIRKGFNSNESWGGRSLTDFVVQDSSYTTMNLNSTYMGSVNCCNQEPVADFKLGTQMGEDVDSHISYVEFESGSVVYEKQIHYTTREELQKLGISFSKTKAVHIPQAFGGFCKRPK